MARINARLHGPAQVSNSAATKYTVPADKRTVVRHIHVSNPSGSPVDFTLSIGADAVGTRLWDGYPIPADSYVDFWGPYTLEETEIIQAFGGTNNILVLVIDGEEIDTV